MKYYTLKNILKENADYNIIIGERSNGKSYACLEKILKDYINLGVQGVYLRRFKEDIINKRMSTLYNPFNISKMTNGKYNSVKYLSGRLFLQKIQENTKENIIDDIPFCYCLSLSDMEHDKSTSYPQVSNILFDEFLTRNFYLKDEFIIFMNILSTIVRNRDKVKIFMLGNTVNNYSPYFDEMGLTNIKNQKQGTIDIYTYSNNGLTVAVEYCNSIDKTGKKSNKYFAFDNPRLKMITSGKWEIGNYLHLPIGYKLNENNLLFSFIIGFNGDNIQLNVYSDNDLFIFAHKKTTEVKENELYYSLNNSGIGIYKRQNILADTLEISNKLKKIISSSKIYYSDNMIGEILRNYLNECRKVV